MLDTTNEYEEKHGSGSIQDDAMIVINHGIFSPIGDQLPHHTTPHHLFQFVSVKSLVLGPFALNYFGGVGCKEQIPRRGGPVM